MNSKRLKHLRSLIKESEHLNEIYDDILRHPREEIADTVNDYRTGFPKTIVIRGYGDSRLPEIRAKIAQNLTNIQDEIAHLENWLSEVEDPEMRDILRLLYVNGMSQEAVARDLGYSRSAIAMKVSRFWERESVTQMTDD